MTDSKGQRHVYLRSMARGERTSLSVLADWVPRGARVLDVGTGSGALGAFLSAERGCVVDGITISEAEATLARDAYRRVEVADLERPGWTTPFAPASYDCIVCADVLEHLREPEKALEALRGLLAPDGRLLVSVPNAGYAGLIADLLAGDFTYRDEGLLDRTHLRFFTRHSIARLLGESGYAVREVQTVQRPVNESEFRARFDDLPPAVSRYLQALPDAGAYQVLLHTTPGAESAVDMPGATAPMTALFTAQAYTRRADGYDEERKVTTAGIVGEPRQVLRFALDGDVQGVRLDPADRPGFLYLHAMRLLRDGAVCWEWHNDAEGMRALAACDHQQMLLATPTALAPGLVLLHGDDPWVELPIPGGQLESDAERVLEVELGWPMSADYLALSGAVHPLVTKAQLELAEASTGLGRMEAQLGDARDRARLAEELLSSVRSDLTRTVEESVQARAQAAQAGLQAEAAREQRDQALAQAAHLSEQAAAREKSLAGQLAQARDRQFEQNLEVRKLTHDKLSVQRELAAQQQQFGQLADHLRWIEASTVFRVTRPAVRAKMALDRWLGRAPAAAPAVAAAEQPAQPIAPTVDVIVPVYRNLEETRCCIEAVLASSGRTPWRLVVLNDASPEPEVTDWLRELAARDGRVTLLENPQNLGFVGTVNRGMAMSDDHDVVLLNSDAEVAGDWLDRLRAAAYRDARVASVTPFSNHATICSYPKFCEPNPMPAGWSVAELDQAFARANPAEVVDVPTGVGFCMYIRRDCLRELGLFDVEQFGKGYGEENDFCRRAADAGWRNLHALDTFVRHSGGVSFGDSKSQRELDAMEKLRRLHPSYERLVHEYVQADPPRIARLRADVARLALRGVPVVLAVAHNRGGGTLRHVTELAAHLGAKAAFFSLLPLPGGLVALELLEPGSKLRLEFRLHDQWEALVDTLRALGVAHVHYHHLIGHDDRVFGLARQLGVTSDFTSHDYFAICPNISLTDQSDRYCGEDGSGDCARCAPNAPNADLVAWRGKHGELLAHTRAVLAPSRDAAGRLLRMWPGLPVRLAPHTDIASTAALPAPAPGAIGERALRVAVLGGMSRIKGADVLEQVATLAAREGAPLEFHLLGHAYRNLHTQPQAALTVHGAYQENDLPRLLAWLKPDIVWFPAQWPETYSYTLSACLEAGLPVVASDLGAFGERLAGRRYSWVQRWDQPVREWLDFFLGVRERHFVRGQVPPPLLGAVDGNAAAVAPWVHETDYLRGLRAVPVGALPAAVLQAAAAPPPAPVASGPGLKRLALSSLVRLRASPGLRRVARAIPSQVQRRVKNWLLA